MTDQHYKTLEDGSIDYGYYKQSGRRMRNDAVHALFADISNIIGALARLIAASAPTRKHIKAGIVAKTTASTKREGQVWRIG